MFKVYEQEASLFGRKIPCTGGQLRIVELLLRFLCALIALILMSGTGFRALAQESMQNGTILGTVTDASGAVLAGATVEISSPAIQSEKLTNTTGADGSYRFPDLPTGIYRISYSMQGFQTQIRSDFSLPVGFTARVDVAMQIGSVSQSVEVSGQAPVIDVTSTTPSSTLERSALEDIPTTRSIWQVQYMAPGYRPNNAPDVGGSQLGAQGGGTNFGISGLITPLLDGIDTQQNATATGYFFDYDSLQEVQIIPVGQQADFADLGTTTVTVMKSGGNDFHGDGRAFGEWQGAELNNASGNLIGKAGNPMVYFYDFSTDLGGRLIRDKLWFYIGWHDEYRKPKVIGYIGPDGKQGYDPLGLTNQEAKGTYQQNKSLKWVGVYAPSN